MTYPFKFVTASEQFQALHTVRSQRPGMLLVAVDGDSETFIEILDLDDNIDEFASACHHYLWMNDLDGIDIVFKYPTKEQITRFMQLLRVRIFQTHLI